MPFIPLNMIGTQSTSTDSHFGTIYWLLGREILVLHGA